VLLKSVIIKIYRTMIIPVVYGCAALSLTLREEHGLRAFNSTVLRNLLGPRRRTVAGN